MDDNRKIDVTEEYKTLMNDPEEINNMDAETLKAISSLIREQETLDSKSESDSDLERGNPLSLTNAYYKGAETRINNNFKHRIDGYAGPIILASITMLFGIIFLLIISSF